MIGYVSIGTNNFAAASEFFDKLFASIGAGRIFEIETFIVWAARPVGPGVALTLPYDGQPATAGNGTMVAIVMDLHEKVDAFHARALQLGATDEGQPGSRGDNFYAAYFRDLDGNKFNAYCTAPAS